MRLWLCLFAYLFVTGCQKASLTTTFSGVAMTIPYRVLVGSRLSAAQMAIVQKTIQETFSEINGTFNQWNPESEVSRLNRQPAGQPFILSPALAEFLRRCDKLFELTEGRFDPTIGPLWALWLESLVEGRAPSQEQIAQVALRTGWKHLKLTTKTAVKDVAGVCLNLDSVSKGHAVDLIALRVEAAGFSNLLVEWGGEMRAVGQHPEARAWRVAIRSIDGQQEPIAQLDLVGASLATSGDYLQNWTIGNGATYTHIVDPVTLQAIQIQPGTAASVSVLAPDCMSADALATAAMAWGSVSAAEPWLQRLQSQLPGVQLWFTAR